MSRRRLFGALARRRASLRLLVLSGVAACCLAADLPRAATVRRVIDGDTIELRNGTPVRYIGIDTPETRRRSGGKWIKELEPLAREATEANRRLVEGKRVDLEYDVDRYDRYGRVLAYVYVEGAMVNEALLAQGYAQLLTIPPNVKHVERLTRALAQAKQARVGLWADPAGPPGGQGEAEESVSRKRRN